MDKSLPLQWMAPGGLPTRGIQVAYFPDHLLAMGALLSYAQPGVEFGLITSICPEEGVAFVRYWSKTSPDELRTTALSERTPLRNLWPRVSKTWDIIDRTLAEIEGDK